MDEYLKLLQSHDWSYDRSDDHSVWKRGYEARQRLYALQSKIDKDYAIWNQYAPEEYRRT